MLSNPEKRKQYQSLNKSFFLKKDQTAEDYLVEFFKASVENRNWNELQVYAPLVKNQTQTLTIWSSQKTTEENYLNFQNAIQSITQSIDFQWNSENYKKAIKNFQNEWMTSEESRISQGLK